jgi:putative membrane protein
VSSLQLLLAQGLDMSLSAPSRGSLFVQHLLAAAAFSIVGILILLITLWLMNRYAPFSIHREIEEDQNVAVGIVIGAILLGISIIIAAAIVG